MIQGQVKPPLFAKKVQYAHLQGLLCVEIWNDRFMMSRGWANVNMGCTWADARTVAMVAAFRLPSDPVLWVSSDVEQVEGPVR